MATVSPIAEPHTLTTIDERWMPVTAPFSAKSGDESVTPLPAVVHELITSFQRALSSTTHDGGVGIVLRCTWGADWDYSALRLTAVPTAGTEQSILVSPAPAPVGPHIEAIRWMKDATGLPLERVAALLGVTRQALYLWERGEPISDGNRRRLLTVRDVLERTQARNPSPAELAAWLDTPRGPDARTPAELLEAGEIDRARLLAITTPSAALRRPPEWARRPVAAAFRAAAELRREAAPPYEAEEELPADYNDPFADEEQEGPEVESAPPDER